MSPTKAPEELYDTQRDPHEIHNLADDPDHRKILDRMRRALRSWIIDTRDTGLLPEPEIYSRSVGLTPYDMARSTDLFPVTRILDTAELVGLGPSKREELTAHLSDPDSAVRWWAAVGLLALGPEARESQAALELALTDESPCVRITAAEALSGIGGVEEALPVLVEALGHEDGWVRLQAAIALGAIGPAAEPALGPMKKALAEKGVPPSAAYVRSALQRAVETLETR